jgi:hypothetical protein
MLHSKLKCNYYGFFNLHFGHISSQSLEFDTFNINTYLLEFLISNLYLLKILAQ